MAGGPPCRATCAATGVITSAAMKPEITAPPTGSTSTWTLYATYKTRVIHGRAYGAALW